MPVRPIWNENFNPARGDSLGPLVKPWSADGNPSPWSMTDTITFIENIDMNQRLKTVETTVFVFRQQTSGTELDTLMRMTPCQTKMADPREGLLRGG